MGDPPLCLMILLLTLMKHALLKCHWSEYYPNAVEPIPLKVPKPHGKAVMTTCFVDANHGRCCVT